MVDGSDAILSLSLPLRLFFNSRREAVVASGFLTYDNTGNRLWKEEKEAIL